MPTRRAMATTVEGMGVEVDEGHPLKLTRPLLLVKDTGGGAAAAGLLDLLFVAFFTDVHRYPKRFTW